MGIENIDDLQLNFDEVIEQYQNDSKKMKTGRASAELVEDIQVEYFGTRTPLIHMATVNVLDAKTIEISPWNKDQLKEIQKAVSQADLGLNPSDDGNIIRIVVPSMTEERRVEMVQQLGKKTEEMRIKIRRFREDFWGGVQDKEKKNEISEDEKFKTKDNLQKLVDEYNKKLEEVEDRKKEELMQV